MFCTYSFLQIFVFSTDFVYVPCSDTLIYGEQLMWTFPNLTLDLQTRITIVLEKETKSQPQPPCVRCERVIIILQYLLNFVFNVTRPPDIKLILSGIYITAETEHLLLLGRQPIFYLIWFIRKLQEKDLEENALFLVLLK